MERKSELTKLGKKKKTNSSIADKGGTKFLLFVLKKQKNSDQVFKENIFFPRKNISISLFLSRKRELMEQHKEKARVANNRAPSETELQEFLAEQGRQSSVSNMRVRNLFQQ